MSKIQRVRFIKKEQGANKTAIYENIDNIGENI